MPVLSGLRGVANDNVPDPMPDPLAAARKRRAITREDTRAALVSARERMLGKIEGNQGNSSKWLAMASGMLAPTRTGGFGESVGAAAGLVGEVQRQNQNAARADESQILGVNKALLDLDESEVDTELELRKLQGKYNMKPVGAPSLFEHPDDPTKLARGQLMYNPETQETEIVYAEDDDGTVPFAVHGLEVGRTGELAKAGAEGKAKGKGQQERTQIAIDTGLSAIDSMRDAKESLAILERVQTSGIMTIGKALANFFGVEWEEGMELSVLQTKLANGVMDKLAQFTGPKSDFELRESKKMVANLGTNTKANQVILNDLIGRLDLLINYGEEEAGFNEDRYANRRYASYREQQAAAQPSGPVSVNTKEEYDALPPGTEYMDGDTRLRKP